MLFWTNTAAICLFAILGIEYSLASSASVCEERNIDFLGNDIVKIEDGSVVKATRCQALCNENSSCLFWTWVPPGLCYLKSSSSGRTKLNGAISGSRSCVPSSDSPNAGNCFEYGVDYFGYDILTLTGVAEPLACKESCLRTPGCGYWSWDSESLTCYLKSDAAFIGRAMKKSIVSGPRVCEKGTQCFETGTDYVGFDIRRLEGNNVESAERCQALCVLEPECAFFSYKQSNRGCYLKSSGALIGRTASQDVTSGPRVCEMTSNDNAGGSEEAPGVPETPGVPEEPNVPGETEDFLVNSCAEGSVEYVGNNVATKLRVFTAPTCQYECSINDACFFWTWDRNASTCYLKGAGADSSRREDTTTLGKVSGAKDCVPLNPSEP